MNGTQSVEIGDMNDVLSAVELNDAIGDQIDVLEKIGGNSATLIFRGRQTILAREVAIRVLPKAIRVAQPEQEEIFCELAKSMASLDHPHFTNVYEVGKTFRGDLFLVTEHVRGYNLRDLSRRGLSPKYANSWIPQICSAIEYLHDQDLIHGNLRPENIIVGKDGKVKLTNCQPSFFNETPPRWRASAYSAPELPKRLTIHSDIYSLGAILYELLTGRQPVGSFPPASKTVSKLDARYDEIIERALKKSPNQRYESVDQMVRDVVHIANTPLRPSAKTSRILLPVNDQKARRSGHAWAWALGKTQKLLAKS